MRYFPVLVVLCLVGCAETRYIKEGTSVKTTEQDLFACEDTILREHDQLRGLNDSQKQTLLDDCMKSKGYRLRGSKDGL